MLCPIFNKQYTMTEVKLATTVQEQISKLKSRGLEINDDSKAEEYLLDIGYYRLGFYLFPFEQSYPRKLNRKHTYKEETNIEDAIELYYFDTDLRNVLLRYISRIEINFRTKLIYYVSNKYKDNPYWYKDEKVVKSSFLNEDAYVKTLNDVNFEDVIKEHKKTHKNQNAQAWKVIEYFSFGIIISLYENIKDGKIKSDISKLYGIHGYNTFVDYLHTIRRLRNACAHGKVLYDINMPVAICNGPAGNFVGTQKTSLFGAFSVLKYILGKISSNRATELRSDLLRIFQKITRPKVKSIICNNSGFDIDKI